MLQFVSLRTPKKYQKLSFGSAILELLDMIIIKYNSQEEFFKNFKYYHKIEKIIGDIQSDISSISRANLIQFYRKKTFCPMDKKVIYK